MLKLIYLAKRKPGFSDDDFIRRWRLHGAKGMSTAFWRHALGYAQAEPIRPVPVTGASGAYDAVAYLMVREDAFSAAAPAEEADTAMMLQDELETFAAPTPSVSLWVNEEHLQPGPLGGFTGFLFFADAAKARPAAEAYRRLSGLHRLILNTRNDAFGAANTLPFQAVVELSALSLPSLKTVLEDASVPVSLADVAVITREAVLWDRLPW